MLCRRGFLSPVYGTGKEKRIAGFERAGTWPPLASFFESGAIGLAYYLQTWFRYLDQEDAYMSTAGRTRSKTQPVCAIKGGRSPPAFRAPGEALRRPRRNYQIIDRLRC